jgi:hypothetical protein
MSKTKLALLALQFADLATTLYVFHLGGYEANPLVAHALPALGATGGILAAKIVALAIVWRMQSPRVVGLACAGMAGVVAWNALVIGLA